jgi:hypothetical protein
LKPRQRSDVSTNLCARARGNQRRNGVNVAIKDAVGLVGQLPFRRRPGRDGCVSHLGCRIRVQHLHGVVQNFERREARQWHVLLFTFVIHVTLFGH